MLNGSTHYERPTNYYESVPSNALERVLWLGSGSHAQTPSKWTMKICSNQRDVVKEEVRGINVLNQPYGGFPWLDMPPIAYRNWKRTRTIFMETSTTSTRATLDDVQEISSKDILRACVECRSPDSRRRGYRDEGDSKLAERYFRRQHSSRAAMPSPANIDGPPQMEEPPAASWRKNSARCRALALSDTRPRSG